MDELQKASGRFDIPPTEASSGDVQQQSSSTMQEIAALKSSSPLLDSREALQLPPIPEPTDNVPLFLDDDPFQEKESNGFSPPHNAEPAWLSEFDPDLINSLRGHVNFVD